MIGRPTFHHRWVLRLGGLALLAACGESQGPEAVGFDAPIVGVPGVDVFYGAYLDHGGPSDYECGFKAYPGHRGVDILLRNFRVQDSGVAVVAAAAGTVTTIRDGIFDRSSTNGSGGFGNHVVLDHGDGIQTTYGHLRSGSVRVSAGQRVGAGTQLGLVGSSGNSNWPHLHFEARSAGGVQDPFQGACNPPASMWRNQLPYQDAFQVTDAGLTDRQAITFADLLERPTSVTVFRTDTTSFLYWLNLANIRSSAVQYVLLGPAGDTVAQLSRGPITTFSVLFLTWRVPIAGVLTTPGTYRVEFLQQPAGGGSLALAHWTTFQLVSVAGPLPARAPVSAAQARSEITVWESGGERRQ
jgi:peptidase M23-like protein